MKRTGETATTGRNGSVVLLLLISAVLSVFPARAWAETTVSATVDRNRMEFGDTFTLTISISSDGDVSNDPPRLPVLQDVDILNQWTSTEARAEFVQTPQGRRFQRFTTNRYNYMLQPQQTGRIHIGAVEVEVGGKTFATKPIEVEVLNSGSLPQQRQAQQPDDDVPPGLFDDDDDLFAQLLKRHGIRPPGSGGSGGDGSGAGSGGIRTQPINPSEAFFIQVEADKTQAYVGEQITVSWYLYTRGQIRDLDTLQYPSLKGFWKEDIEIATHLNFQQEVVNGIPYKKALLASYALFPIKEGTAVVDSYKAKCTVIAATDSFGAFSFGKPYTYTKASQPVKITVKPLPVEGRPADFSGAVGSFQIRASVEDKVINMHEPFTFKIRLEGRGNAKVVDLPPMTLPDELERYDEQSDAKFFRTGTSYKDFSLNLIPRASGPITIPAISMSMFDPQAEKYVTRTTEPLTIEVGTNGGVNVIPPSPLTADAAKPDEQKGRPTPQALSEWRPWSPTPLSHRLGWCAGALSVAFLVLLGKARVEFGWGQRKRDLTQAVNRRFKRVHERIDKGDWRGVGVEVTNAVYFVLGEVSGQGGANVELEKLWLQAPPSVRRELSVPVSKLMESFQALTFAPEEVVGSLKEKPQLKKLVSDMEKLMTKAVALALSADATAGSETPALRA